MYICMYGCMDVWMYGCIFLSTCKVIGMEGSKEYPTRLCVSTIHFNPHSKLRRLSVWPIVDGFRTMLGIEEKVSMHYEQGSQDSYLTNQNLCTIGEVGRTSFL